MSSVRGTKIKARGKLSRAEQKYQVFEWVKNVHLEKLKWPWLKSAVFCLLAFMQWKKHTDSNYL